MLDTMCGVLVNGNPISKYSGAALLNYSIGGSAIDNTTFRGLNRSHFELLQSSYGTRQIKITIVFDGDDLHSAKMNKSTFDGDLWGRVEVFIPDDGFLYDCTVDSLGADELVGVGETNAKIKATYTFSGFRRDAMHTATVPRGGTLMCLSTVPFTDCRITATVTTSATTYTMGGAVWPDVESGDVLVFDGINKRITKNGANAAASVSWVDFPRLLRGENRNDAPDAVVIEYYPTYL